MSTPRDGQQGSAAFPPALLTTKDITKLTDAAMAAFGQLHDIELRAKRIAKARLAVALADLDLFGLTANRTDSAAREYQPDERDWCP
jgi:hypothetical protein